MSLKRVGRPAALHREPANCREPPGKNDSRRIKQSRGKRQERRKKRRFSNRDVARAAFVYQAARTYTNVEIFHGGRVAVEAIDAKTPKAARECEQSFRAAIEQTLPIIRALFGEGAR
jgi:hypothetical protein